MAVVESKSSAADSLLTRLPFYYGWVNVAVAALAMTATLPGRTHGLGLITKPLLSDLKISDVWYSELNFLAILIGAAFCLPVGRLIDRLGTRVVLTGVAGALGVVVLCMSRVEDDVTLFITLTLVRGLGQGALSVVSLALAGKWFTRRLGLAMGVFAVLLTFGFIGSILGLREAVEQYDWRFAWAGMGWLLLLGLAPLGALLVRKTPEACGLAPDREADSGQSVGKGTEGVTLGRALRSPSFWIFSLATSLFNLLWSGITLFNEKILNEQGFGDKTFDLVMALLAGSGLISNLLAGWLATRWSMGRLLGLGMILLAGSLAAFPLIDSQVHVILYALVLGASGGIITVVFFAIYGHTFGRAHLGHIQGAAQVLSVIASALGPVILTLSRAGTGSYDLFFYGLAPVAGLLGLCAWKVRPPRSDLAMSQS